MINSLEFASFLRQQTIQKTAESEVEELIAQTSRALREVWESAITDVLTEAARFLRIDSLEQVTLDDIGILSSMMEESLGDGLISSDQYTKMKDLMQSSYIKGATSAAEGSGVTLQWGAPDQKSLNTISQNARYWINTYFDDNVQAGIDDVLKGHFAGGSNRRKVAESLKDHFQGRIKKDDNYWDLLADHTMTKTLEIGRVSGYEQAGIDYVKIDAVMDSRTSKICRVMNGRVIPVSSLRGQADKYLSACDTGDKGKIKKSWPWVSAKQAETYKNHSTKKLVSSGVSLPPYHGRCRTITVAHFGDVPDDTPEIVKPKPKPKPKPAVDKEKEAAKAKAKKDAIDRAEAKAKDEAEKKKNARRREDKELRAKEKALREAKKKAEKDAITEAKSRADKEAKERDKAEAAAKKKEAEDAKEKAKKAKEFEEAKAAEAKRKADRIAAKAKAKEDNERKAADARRKAEAEAESKRKADERRMAEERKAKAKAEASRRKAEEAERARARKAEEARKKAEAEAKRRAEEVKRKAEAERKAAEARRVAASKKAEQEARDKSKKPVTSDKYAVYRNRILDTPEKIRLAVLDKGRNVTSKLEKDIIKLKEKSTKLKDKIKVMGRSHPDVEKEIDKYLSIEKDVADMAKMISESKHNYDDYRDILKSPISKRLYANTDSVTPVNRVKIEKGIEEVESIMGLNRSIIDEVRYISNDSVQRAYFKPSAMSIYVSPKSSIGTIAHETGHFLEKSDRTIREKVHRFLDGRITDDTIRQIYDHLPDELYQEAGFVNKYTSKIYKNDRGERVGSEVLSMGMTHIFNDGPYKFAKDDPDFFDFIMRVLKDM